jgi:dynein heavy chain, axonemal
MDDNKVLTLVSQERIPLTPSMRLILEISNLRNATPATVSRGGVLFINDSDIGYQPFITSWMDQFKKGARNDDEVARTVFDLCFKNYLSDNLLDHTRTGETVAPMVTISYIQSLTCIIDFLFKESKEKKEQSDFIKSLKEKGPEEDLKKIYEAMFIFALMWSFGAAFTNFEKAKFSGSLKAGCKNIKFPESKDEVFKFYFDVCDLKFQNWSNKVQNY